MARRKTTYPVQAPTTASSSDGVVCFTDSSGVPPTIFRPGDFAPLTGIYRATHQGHRPDHDVIGIRGENFPACRSCKLEVIFTLVRAAEHAMHDMDFAGPALRWKRRRASTGPADSSVGLASPAIHSVHFYDNDESLVARLLGIVVGRARIGDSVLIIATPAHRQQLVSKLEKHSWNIRARVREGRFTMVDAQEALDTFMVNGLPDPNLFAESIGKLIADAKKAARTNPAVVSIFGEMVTLLWEAGNHEGALHLEALWTEVSRNGTEHVHCAYPRRHFNTTDFDQKQLAAICGTHTHVASAATA